MCGPLGQSPQFRQRHTTDLSFLNTFPASTFARSPRYRRSCCFSATATARNIAADIYSALLVLAGMVVIRFTGWNILDPIIALLIVLWLFKIAVDLIRRSSSGLVDEKLPPTEEEIINSTIMEHCSQLLGYHRLRTRRSGYQRYIDLHLVVPRDTSVADAHRITEHLEQDIRRKLPHTSMIIHIEPCNKNCDECTFTCKSKGNPVNPERGS